MKKTILILSLFILSLQTITAQKSNDSSFKDKTWYGAHLALGFGASSIRSSLVLGISPMMGYRVFDRISVGPRANILYHNSRFKDLRGNTVLKVNSVDLGIGLFLRAEVYKQYFAQVELLYESNEEVFTNGEKFKINGANAYIGVGTNIGGRNPSMELMVTYDFNLQATYKPSLVNFRFGFTMNY